MHRQGSTVAGMLMMSAVRLGYRLSTVPCLRMSMHRPKPLSRLARFMISASSMSYLHRHRTDAALPQPLQSSAAPIRGSTSSHMSFCDRCMAARFVQGMAKGGARQRTQSRT